MKLVSIGVKVSISRLKTLLTPAIPIGDAFSNLDFSFFIV